MSMAQPHTRPLPLDWREEALGSVLAQAVVQDPLFEDVRTMALRDSLAALAPGSRVWIYGCGAVSARLAASGGLRPDLDLAFLESAPAEASFHGHARLSPAQALELPAPAAIILASGAYVPAMRAALGPLGAQALALEDLLRTGPAARAMDQAWRRITDLAEEARAKLTLDDGRGRRILFLGYQSLGRPHFFRELAPEWRPRLLSHNLPDESYLERLRHEKALEFVNMRHHQGVFFLVAACLLTGDGFALAVVAYEHSAILPVLLLAASKCRIPLVLWSSNFFLRICAIPSRMGYFERLLGRTAAELTRMEVELLRNTDAVVCGYEPEFVDSLRSRHGLDFAFLRATMPIDTETDFDLLRPLPAVPPELPVDVVMPKSIYVPGGDPDEDSKIDCAWNDRDVRLFSEALDGQRVQLTVYNAIDDGQDCFAPLRDYAASRPNLVYRRRVDRFTAFRELERFAFGWLVKPVTPQTRDLFRRQIPDAVFTYLRCGLPAIVSEELQAASRLVLALGIGFSIRADQLGQVEALCRAFDREAYAQRRREALAQMGSTAFGQRLREFLSTLPGR